MWCDDIYILAAGKHHTLFLKRICPVEIITNTRHWPCFHRVYFTVSRPKVWNCLKIFSIHFKKRIELLINKSFVYDTVYLLWIIRNIFRPYLVYGIHIWLWYDMTLVQKHPQPCTSYVSCIDTCIYMQIDPGLLGPDPIIPVFRSRRPDSIIPGSLGPDPLIC